MLYVFIVGPASLVLWVVAPFVAKPVALLSIAESTRLAAFAHAALMNMASVATKLLGLQFAIYLSKNYLDQWLLGGDWITLLYPFSAVYLLTVVFWIGACVEYLYVRWRIEVSGGAAFRRFC